MALVTVQRSPTPSTSSSPCVSESGSGEDDRRSQPRSISESFLTVKGAALFLPRGNGSSPSSASRFSQLRSKHAGDIQQHLQTMFTLLRPEDNIKLAVRLESSHAQVTRYMVVVSTVGRQDTEESVVLGMDFSPVDGSCSVGLVLPLWSDTLIHLDGDGGFSVSTDNRVHVFKPVSVQAMWSALQSLHKACEVARCHNYFPGSLFLTWVSYYQSRVSSDQARINEWNAMQDVQSHRADSPVLFSDVPTERELTERQIKTSLREIMMQKDLENVTCKEIRTELEMHMTCNLREFKEFIDNEMIVILGQMDSPTEIFDHVFLGSEWNASNLEELQKSGVQYILNVTREIDNFFPGVFEYHNIRVYDEEATDLLAYWNDTFKFISRAKKSGSRCLVHCKMGISRSAATVIAYAMKEFGWDLKKAFDYVKERRTVTKPNPSFMRQLEEYQGILLASKQRHNKLWRSHSDSDLSEHHEPLSKSYAQPHSLGRSDPHNQASSMLGPSVKELLESLGSSASTGKESHSKSQPDTGVYSSHLGSSSFGGAAALSGDAVAQSLKGPPHADTAPSRQLDSSTAGSVSSSPPLSNGLSDSEEQPSYPPLSQPKAATVVPEPQRTEITVAQSILVAQQPTLLKSAAKEQLPLTQEVPDGEVKEEEKKQEVLVPVQVTGAKPTETLGQQDPLNPPHSQELTKPKQEVEEQDVCSPKEVKTKDDEEAAPAPRLYSDWTRGSVRRVTQQLEQRMKQEHEAPTPSSSLPSLSGYTNHQRRPNSIHSTTMSPPQDASAAGSGRGGEDGTFRPANEGNAQVNETGVPVPNDKGTKGDDLQPDDARSFSTSLPLSTQSPFASVNFLCLEGVTELESAVDWDGFTEGSRSQIIMRDTWETLCELGAFLHQVSMAGACKSRRIGQALGTAQKRGSRFQKKAREVEARIRQAGLTPPSLMKRSASLAKLGCLELLPNDLSEWELGCSAVAPPSAQAPVNDESKKQRVHNSPSSGSKQPEGVELTPARLSKAGEGLPGISEPLNSNPHREKLQNTSQDSLLSPVPTLLTTRQQYGRTHPLRQLKKRTVSTLYHTM
uniref:protein-serine/threonine phosphatase n=1 Tax=Nothobranchius kuhntae TaxID=321403 RepID=A0A1A8I824_NOTKU